MIFLFWISIIMVIYAYLGYLFLLIIFSLFLTKPVIKGSQYKPHVTLIVSAYNEEKVIEEKIKNSLLLDYPKKKLEIMVVSDESSDRTEEIAAKYIHQGIKILRIEGRVGKTSCLNKAVPEAKGDIILFSDANSHYNKEALREITANFADENVGCVTGFTKYMSKDDNTIAESVGIYSKLERLTKEYESMLTSCVGADGAIFAIRKKLYKPLNVWDINDFVIPLSVVRQGYRTILEKGCWCCEETAKDSKGEFNRQVRITNRTLRAIFNNKDLLNVLEYKLFSFELFSHKVIKFLVPLFMILIFISNLVLIRRNRFYKLILFLQCLLYGMSTTKIDKHKSSSAKFVNTIRTFVVVNFAITKGWKTYLKDESFTTWKTSR
jgi:cellulose synthase/poly-beta-1,6-N-acetylglucosamine synthase-like glycosyltransferase